MKKSLALCRSKEIYSENDGETWHSKVTAQGRSSAHPKERSGGGGAGTFHFSECFGNDRCSSRKINFSRPMLKTCFQHPGGLGNKSLRVRNE